MSKYNVLIGRFQPLTTAHLKCAKTAFDMTGNKVKLLMIYRNNSKISDKNPFDCEWLAAKYHEMLKNDDWYGGIEFVTNADLVKISQQVDFTISGWVCGTDRYQAYSEFIHKYKPLMKVTYDFRLICVARPDDDVSATEAREALHNNDYDVWCKCTPFNTGKDFSLFQQLRGQKLEDEIRLALNHYKKRFDQITIEEAKNCILPQFEEDIRAHISNIICKLLDD